MEQPDPEAMHLVQVNPATFLTQLVLVNLATLVLRVVLANQLEDSVHLTLSQVMVLRHKMLLRTVSCIMAH